MINHGIVTDDRPRSVPDWATVGPWDKAKVRDLGKAWVSALSGVAESTPGSLAKLACFLAPPPPDTRFRLPQPAITNVYFIGGELGPVKIGMASNVKRRLRDLQMASPIELAILATVEGPPLLEREYHKRFAAHRLHGEWFTRYPETEAEIALLNGGVA